MKTRTGYRSPARNRRTAPWNPQASAVASGPSLAGFAVAGGVITLVFGDFVSLGPELPEVYYRSGTEFDSAYVRVPVIGAVQDGANQIELETDPAFTLPSPAMLTLLPGVDGIRDNAGGTAWGAAVGGE